MRGAGYAAMLPLAYRTADTGRVVGDLVTVRGSGARRMEPGLCGCAPATQICALKWRSAGCLPVRDHAAMLLVLACQYGLAALPARDDEITSSTRARQSSR
jgi:hypothetical protein